MQQIRPEAGLPTRQLPDKSDDQGEVTTAGHQAQPGPFRPPPCSVLLRAGQSLRQVRPPKDSSTKGGIRSTAARHSHGTGHAPSRSALPPGNVVRAVIGRYGLTPPLGGAVSPVSKVLVCASPRSSCSKAARATSVPRKKS